MQVLITGASGSGTTTLGQALATDLGATFIDADDVFWLPSVPPYQHKRPAQERLKLLRESLAASVQTVVSGSIQAWGDAVESAFDLIVFLQVPTEIRIDRLRRRESARFGTVDETFIAWAEQYDEGLMEGRSLAGQLAWLESRQCAVLKFVGEHPLSDLLPPIRDRLRSLALDRTAGLA